MQFFILIKKFLFNKLISPLIKILRYIFNKKVLKIIFCFLCLSFLIFSPNNLFDKKNYQLNLNEYLNLSNKQKVILDLWHIESFEGGTNNRGKYLEKQSIKFNKKNNNCYINVTTLTLEQLYLNVKENKFPDIFSFGLGAGYIISGLLENLPENNCIREDLKNYGCISGEILAYPYMMSGYCAITKSNLLQGKDFIIDSGFNNVTYNRKQIKGIGFAKVGVENISKAMLENKLFINNKDNYFTLSSTYDAYTNFLTNKFVTLVGTARDVARCKNRESNGSLSSCEYNFLGGYTDLIQYIGVNKNISNLKKKICINFSNFLISENCQKDISNYGLFSTNSLSIYENDYMQQFEQILSKPIKSINVFINYENIEKNKSDCFNKLFL